MPLVRYFTFVGGTLIALLLIVNAALPAMPLPENLASGSDLPTIRIHSDRKLPERVVFDTSVVLPTRAAAAPVVIAQAKLEIQAQVPAPMRAAAQAPAKPAIAQLSAKARVREAFAQLPQEQDAFEPKMTDMATVVVPEPKMYPARQSPKKIAAKPHTARPMMIVAQQPRFGGMATW
jgi:hypothetical protein